jgi:rubrerythrin
VTARAEEPIGSVAILFAFELGEKPASSIGIDLRFGSILDACCRFQSQTYSDAVGGFLSFAYVIKGGLRFMAGVDYAEHEGSFGSGAQLAWFYRASGPLGPETHGLALGAFIRPELSFELGANAFLTLDTLDLSMNTWFAARLSTALTGTVVEGRPLSLGGHRVHVPFTVDPNHLPHRAEAPLAAYWRRAALAERGSVTTFLELASDLTSIGAPDSLVQAARRAAKDEHRHATLAEGLAARHGPSIQTRAPALPRRRPESYEQRLARLTHEALNEGLLNESLAARDAAIAATRCREPTTRTVLRLIADDEQRHADLAGATLAFCLERAPHLREDVVAVLEHSAPPTSSDHPDGYEHLGVQSREQLLALANETHTRVTRRLRAAI